MSQVILTSRAAEDLARLQHFYREQSESYALKARDALRSGLDRLSQFPAIGRVCLEYPEFREWLIPFGSSGFVILYRLTVNECLIIAVKHQREAGYQLN